MDWYFRSMPSLSSRRFVRRVALSVGVPTLLLSASLSSMAAIAAIDGAGMLPARIRKLVPVVYRPVIWYAEAGLPGHQKLPSLVFAAYEFGDSFR